MPSQRKKSTRARPSGAGTTPAAAIEAQRGGLMGELLGPILHEVNNLLTPAMTYCELAKANPGDALLAAKATDYTLDAIAGVREASETLLALARSSPTDSEASAPLPALVGGIVSCLAPLARRQGVLLQASTPLPPVCVRATAVRHILLNLTLNALRATPRGGRVRVGTQEVVRQSRPRSTWNAMGSVAITIDDSGLGLPVAARRILCDSTGATTISPGLGLRVCALLIRSLHGRVVVAKSPLGGARIVVDVPIVVGASSGRSAA